MRSVRWPVYMSASGVHCETPVAPCIWIAWSMIWHVRSGIIALTAWTHTRASRLPRTSIALAARRTMRRIASMSMRARDTTSMFLPSWMIGRPKASRDMPRLTIRSSAFSAWPTDRMQWWIRPGPSRSWEISKPRPSPSRMFSFGTRTLSSLMCMWPWGAWSCPKTFIGPRTFTPGVSIGTRIWDCWR